ncbi:MAG: sialate O-acetylesterase [Planctomycetes bacterium]|nr:sialate O-acetylesterase [Planctomycetota bacterium]
MRLSARLRTFSAALVALVSLAAGAMADVKLPAVLGSGMVLQQKAKLPLWGWADPGEKVTITLGDQKTSATAGDDGRWSVTLEPLEAGGPHELTVAGKNTLKLENILVGEVWVCSGQSNMQWSVTQSDNPEEEIAAAKYPKIRLFYVPRVPSGTPQDDVNAQWVECSPETVAGFSAVAYYFGRKLHQELDVPVGLIHTSWGGTRIEPWTPPEGFEAVPELRELATRVKQQQAAWEQARKEAAQAGQEPPKHPLTDRQDPQALYNAMVHPLVPFAIRGAIWYQGESNRGEGLLYHHKMKALIRGWREIWDRGDFPFLFVQLAPFNYGGNQPHQLPEIWEAQLLTLRTVPNTGMAVTTDIGNVADIHPRNKQDVGLRLALWALAGTYGKKDVVYSGPLYKSMEIDGNKAVLHFEHAKGLAAKDDQPLTRFEIAGEDGKFVPAEAQIEGETVVVSSEQVAKPTAVRFAWSQDAEPNLVNAAGLPASPFRTNGPRPTPEGDIETP